MPNRFFRDSLCPCSPDLIHPAEQVPPLNRGCHEPVVYFVSHPIGHWNRSDVASLSDKINDRPVLFALLKVIQSQPYGFCLLNPQASSSASNARSRFPFSR